jgi:hypothetical protein
MVDFAFEMADGRKKLFAHYFARVFAIKHLSRVDLTGSAMAHAILRGIVVFKRSSNEKLIRS